jgi:hypothetical protein
LVPEAQERVLSFLVECVKLILHDFSEDAILQSPVQPLMIFSKTVAGYASLATVAAEAPYQKPDSLDFARIASLLAAKYDHIADHIWSLREDPGYFEAQMLEYKENRQELLSDAWGRPHPICSTGEEDKLWTRVIIYQISRAYFQLELFADLVSQAETLTEMQELHADGIGSSADFSQEYTTAILRFQHYLLRAANASVNDLCKGFPASPPIRQYHRRKDETEDPAAEVTMVEQNLCFREDPTRARLYWLLVRLWKNDDLPAMIGLPETVEELQRLANAESANSLISTYVASVNEDLAIASTCIHQLELYQPWSHVHDGLLSEQERRLEQENAPRMKLLEDMFHTMDSRDYELGNLGGPTNGKFTYPIAKRRTRENVETMRCAERNLDKFWHKVDQDMKSKSSGLGGMAVHRLLTQGRQLQRTPEWVEPVRQKIQPPIEELYIPFSQLSLDDKKSNDQSLHESSVEPPKEKIKTRKTGTSEDVAVDAEAVIPPTEAKSEPIFALNARALKVFKMVFFTPSVSSTLGEVAWADFLYVMVSVCFNPEKLYGSVWQFSPDP